MRILCYVFILLLIRASLVLEAAGQNPDPSQTNVHLDISSRVVMIFHDENYKAFQASLETRKHRLANPFSPSCDPTTQRLSSGPRQSVRTLLDVSLAV